MIDDAMMAGRLDRLTNAIAASGLDAAAIVPGANFYFLTGANFHLMERPTVLFVTRDGARHAVIPLLEQARWKALAPDVETEYWQDADGFEAAFERVAKRLTCARLGVEGQLMRVFESEVLRRTFGNTLVVDAHADISTMRLCKDEAELALMRRAVEISEAALASTIAWAEIGMSETQVKSKLLAEMLCQGAEGIAFDPIVLSGAASADPHGVPNEERKLATGGALLIDFGASFAGYNADITRTFFVGQPSDRHHDIYQAVLTANARGRAACAPGLTLHQLDELVTAELAASGFAEMIVHKTGHGLGLDVHEAPQVMIGNHQALEPGMVITIEPGLYRSGEIGIRIEDDVVVTEQGSVSLTTFEREITIIEG